MVNFSALLMEERDKSGEDSCVGFTELSCKFLLFETVAFDRMFIPWILILLGSSETQRITSCGFYVQLHGPNWNTGYIPDGVYHSHSLGH